jgi:hypothetical protein
MTEQEVGYRIAKDGESPKFYLSEDVEKLLAAKDKEIRRLHRCIIRMTRQWLSAVDDMYSRLDDVDGLDDQDVIDWDKVTDLHDNLNKVLEKWK